MKNMKELKEAASQGVQGSLRGKTMALNKQWQSGEMSLIFSAKTCVGNDPKFEHLCNANVKLSMKMPRSPKLHHQNWMTLHQSTDDTDKRSVIGSLMIDNIGKN